MNTHLRNNYTEMLEVRSLELRGSPYYSAEDTEAWGVVCVRSFKSGAVVFLFHPASVIK